MWRNVVLQREAQAVLNLSEFGKFEAILPAGTVGGNVERLVSVNKFRDKMSKVKSINVSQDRSIFSYVSSMLIALHQAKYNDKLSHPPMGHMTYHVSPFCDFWNFLEFLKNFKIGTPTWHTHLPHPPATPTCHAHWHTPWHNCYTHMMFPEPPTRFSSCFEQFWFWIFCPFPSYPPCDTRTYRLAWQLTNISEQSNTMPPSVVLKDDIM